MVATKMKPTSAFKSLTLYHASLSGCSARVRIAAHLKSIPVTYHTINISASEQQSPSYVTINPNASVPSLLVEPSLSSPTSSLKESFTITQSPAILDFLDCHFPQPALLPGMQAPINRARVLELASLVACDIQPPQNSRVRKQIKQRFAGDGEAWARWVYERGLTVYESLVERSRLKRLDGMGEERFSVGGEVSLADVFLVPAVQGGLKVGVELERWPLVKGIVEECWKLESFKKGGLGLHGRLVP
jgi:maleylacetoacetate isomerase